MLSYDLIGFQSDEDRDNFLGQPDTQVVAMCDLDQKRLEAAKNAVDTHYSNKDCAAYRDFREALQSDRPATACQNCGLRWSL